MTLQEIARKEDRARFIESTAPKIKQFGELYSKLMAEVGHGVLTGLTMLILIYFIIATGNAGVMTDPGVMLICMIVLFGQFMSAEVFDKKDGYLPFLVFATTLLSLLLSAAFPVPFAFVGGVLIVGVVALVVNVIATVLATLISFVLERLIKRSKPPQKEAA